MKRRGRLQLVNRFAADRTLLGQRVRHLLDDFEAMTAGVALVFVKRHELYSSMSPLSSPSISCRCSQNGAVPLASSVSWNERSENALPCCCFQSCRSLSSINLPAV